MLTPFSVSVSESTRFNYVIYYFQGSFAHVDGLFKRCTRCEGILQHPDNDFRTRLACSLLPHGWMSHLSIGLSRFIKRPTTLVHQQFFRQQFFKCFADLNWYRCSAQGQIFATRKKSLHFCNKLKLNSERTQTGSPFCKLYSLLLLLLLLGIVGQWRYLPIKLCGDKTEFNNWISKY